jgi:hypothetical protein
VLTKRRMRIVVAGTVVAALAATGLAYGTTRPRPAALALRLTPGETLRYRVTVSLDGWAGPAMDQSAVHLRLAESLVWHVVSVGRSGVATVRLSTEGVSVNGRAVGAGLTGASSLVPVAPDGRFISAPDTAVLTGGLPGTGLPGIGQLATLLPDRPVTPGDTWSRSFDQDYAPGGRSIEFRGHGRFVRYEDVDGVRSAVIAETLSAPVNVQNALGEASGPPAGSEASSGAPATVRYSGWVDLTQQAWLDPRSGRLVRESMTGPVRMALTFDGFPSLFPTFVPPADPSGAGSFFQGPFAPPSATGPGSSGRGQEKATVLARLRVTMRLEP